MTMGRLGKTNRQITTYLIAQYCRQSGKVYEFAKEFAESEFEKYRIIQDRLFQSDFDRFEDNSLPPLDEE